MIFGLVGVVLAIAGFAVGERRGARRERRRAEQDRARAVAYGRGSKP